MKKIIDSITALRPTNELKWVVPADIWEQKVLMQKWKSWLGDFEWRKI